MSNPKIKMTLKECIDQWDDKKYECIRYIVTNDKFNIDKYGFIKYYGSNREFDVSSITWLAGHGWELIEKEEVPEGFSVDSSGNFFKHATIALWVNVFWDKFEQREITKIYSSETLAKCSKNDYNKERVIFIKTLYLAQQYAIPYSDIKGK